jgi:hypothetical protein
LVFIAVLALDDPGYLSIVDRGIELLQVEDVAGDDIRAATAAFVRCRALIDQTEHAVLEEAACLLADRVAIEPRNAATLSNGFILQHDAADDFICGAAPDR